MDIESCFCADQPGAVAEPDRDFLSTECEAEYETAVELFPQHLLHVFAQLLDGVTEFVARRLDFDGNVDAMPPKMCQRSDAIRCIQLAILLVRRS